MDLTCYCMSMLTRRLQVLIDDARWQRLESAAERQRVPVSVLVREAIDAAYPATDAVRREAGRRVLDAVPMPVPAVGDLAAELDDLRGRHG